MTLTPRLVQALLDVRRIDPNDLASRIPEGVADHDFLAYARKMSEWQDVEVPQILSSRDLLPADLFPIVVLRRLMTTSFQHVSAKVQEALSSEDLPPSLRKAWSIIRANLDARAGRTAEAIAALRSALSRKTESPAVDRYLDAWTHQAVGRLQRGLGDFRSAWTALREAERILPDQSGGSTHRRRLNHDMGSLHWASGQYRRALEVHCNRRFREAAKREDDWEFLVQTHLSAAKCAIDLGAATKANEELCSAKELLDQRPASLPMSSAQLALFSAELDTLFGNDDEAIHLFEYAIEQFEGFDPPYYQGVLDAKIGLVRFQLERGDFKRSFRRLGELLDEAERNGCIEARTRLLAYQAKLLLRRGEDPKVLRQAYDDLVTRAHLMNNPHLTMLAYADLYMFAREHLTAEEQRQWLERLRGLRRVLDQSCFDDLYRDYVLERYRREVEGPLDDLGIDLPDS